MSATAVASGIGLLLQLIEQTARVSAAIKEARANGLPDITPEQLAAFVAERDAAREELKAAIDAG